jgi:hypothetical protein
MHWVIKMAFLLFYLRFATAKTFKFLVYGTMGLNTLFAIITWLLYVLQCVPLDAYFNPAAHPAVKCLDKSILAFVPAAFVRLLPSNFTSWIELTIEIERLRRYCDPHSPNQTTLAYPSQPSQTSHPHQHPQSREFGRSSFHAPVDRTSPIRERN